MAEALEDIATFTTPARVFGDDKSWIRAFAVLLDGRRMGTVSLDGTLRLWDLQDGIVLKKMEGRSGRVEGALAISRDGRFIASGYDRKLIVWDWDGDTYGESVIQPIETFKFSTTIWALDFSADGAVLASCDSNDKLVKLWNTTTWQLQGKPIDCGGQIAKVKYVRFSPSGEHLAIAIDQLAQPGVSWPGWIEIWHLATMSQVRFGHDAKTLAWTPDGTQFLLAGNGIDEWDTSTWKQVGDRWEGHTAYINAIAINPAGTLVASASSDKHVRLWSLSDRRTIAIFQHANEVNCVAFSVDGKHVLSHGGHDKTVSEWVAEETFLADARKEQQKKLERESNRIFTITATARDACISGELHAAEELLTREIHADANNYCSYANRSFIMARKHDWDNALHDANKSIAIQPSLTGCISKGIALCGQGKVRDAIKAFDIASMFTNGDPKTNHFLLLTKAITLFNADQHEEAIQRVQELADMCPNSDTLACRVVEAYLHVRLGIDASDGAHYDEAADHFAAAVKSCSFSSTLRTHYLYEDFVVLFGWDFESLWLTAHQKQCQVLLSAGRLDDALESLRHMMEIVDETTKVACLDWSTAFQQECSAAAEADRVLRMEIPGQDQHDGIHEAERDFFGEMYDHHQTSSPRHQQRPGRIKKLLAVARTPRAAPPPAPPTNPSSATAPATFKTRLRHLLTVQPVHAATPPVVDVPFAQGKERNAAAGAPRNSADGYVDWVSTHSQQQTPAGQNDTGQGEHGSGRCCCF